MSSAMEHVSIVDTVLSMAALLVCLFLLSQNDDDGDGDGISVVAVLFLLSRHWPAIYWYLRAYLVPAGGVAAPRTGRNAVDRCPPASLSVSLSLSLFFFFLFYNFRNDRFRCRNGAERPRETERDRERERERERERPPAAPRTCVITGRFLLVSTNENVAAF